MATIEQPPIQRIPRSRSTRLADQAATAALYVTHPERRLSAREPSAIETDLSNLKVPGSRPGFSHASAVAALAHAKSRQLEAEKQAAAAFYVQDLRSDVSSHGGYRAGASTRRDRNSISNVPPSTEISVADLTSEARREITEREKAVSAARGALYSTRKRAESAPSKAPYANSAAGQFKDLDNAMEASRIQHLTNINPQLFTASPPVAQEIEDQRRKSVLQAAAVSMARDMYSLAEATEPEQFYPSAPVTQTNHGRVRQKRSASRPEAGAIQRAVSLQETAQKLAAQKLASMQDDTAVYREYYGIEPQTTRSSLPTRRRRLSLDSDASEFDVERSREIRHQMTSLRTKLDAVDEQREKDRALLMVAAKKNVDAVLQDMEMRVCAETGRAPPSLQKEWEEAALARAQKDIQDTDTQYASGERVNLGAQKFVNMSDVEALARSRLQPTFDEITDRAETERAKELERRLDAEEIQRREIVARQREADLLAEEKRQKASMKQELKGKGERTRLWRKSKRTQDNEPTLGTPSPTKATERLKGAAEAPAESAPQETGQPQTAEAGNKATASGAVVDSSPMEPITRTESKLKTWFSKLGSRRPNSGTGEAPKVAGADQEAPAEMAEETIRAAEGPNEPAETAEADEVTDDDERGAPLRSNPVTADDLQVMQRNSVHEGTLEGVGSEGQVAQQGTRETSEHNGDKRSRLKFRLSQMVSRNSQDTKTNGVTDYGKETEGGSAPVEHTAADELPSHTTDRDELRESATEQGLPTPPAIGKRTSDGTGRESRFSEDLS
ncbi:uncharacterized protein BDW43DRAFT_284436 [Aspergillus alliaceus]|uniref:uncharacterized protein n=1 Tax=Petromyces alliaceus TaxID=209559 RepID=UPI0012A4951C|nr:uncharacterized protein BDW43DRAFT_284436 [Aspergillus alliaceus]KAB8230682.1 hypothetical protein BDW43DRAFT_284436 [Aspergillus alliaceus]